MDIKRTAGNPGGNGGELALAVCVFVRFRRFRLISIDTHLRSECDKQMVICKEKTRCRKTTSISQISSLLVAFSVLGSLLDVVDDGVDDGVEVVAVDLVVVDLDVEIDLDADPGSDGGHNRPFQLPRGDCRPLSVWRIQATCALTSHETRSQPPKKPNNTSLHQPRSHLVLTSACQ